MITNSILNLLNFNIAFICIGTCSTIVVASDTKAVLVRDMRIIILAYDAPTMRSIGTTSKESRPTSQQHAKATMIATKNVEKFDIK